MKTSKITIPTSAVNNIPNEEYIDIIIRSKEQYEEAQAKGFEILYKKYAGHLITYIQVKWSDIMGIKQ